MIEETFMQIMFHIVGERGQKCKNIVKISTKK